MIFNLSVKKPTWQLCQAIQWPNTWQGILTASDKMFWDKVSAYLAFETNNDRRSMAMSGFCQELHDNKVRAVILKEVANIKCIELSSKPIVVSWDLSSDLTRDFSLVVENKDNKK